MRYAACRLEPGQTGHDAGWALLEALYREETGCPLPRVVRNHRGHPRFADSHLCFSIAHTDRHAFCVLAPKPVGIDAEELDRPVRFSLAKRIFSPAEQLRFAAAANPQEAFLALWVLKEAAAKCSGLGLVGFPNQTDFSPEDPRVRRWAGCLVAIVAQETEEGVIYHDF